MATQAKIVVTAQDSASRVLDKVRSSMNEVSAVATRVGTALGLVGVAGIGGLVAMTKSAVDSVDRLNDLSDATGASIENISALEDTAARTGTSMDTVSTALVKFNAVLKEAKPGSGVEQALDAIGLSVKELRDLDPADALLKTAVALQGFADDGNKARIVQELFGKSIKEVAPLLKDLADKGRLVATVTTEAAKQAEKFNQELFNLQKNTTDGARAMVGPLVSAINKTIEVFRLGAIAGKSFWQILRGEQLRAIGLNDGPEEYAAQLAEVNAQLAKGDTRLVVRSALLRQQATLQAKLKNAPDFSADNDSSAELARLNRRPSLAPLPDKEKKPKAEKTQAQKDEEDFAKRRMEMQRQLSIEAGDAVNKENQRLADEEVKLAEATASDRLKIQRQLVLDEYDLRMKLQADEEKSAEDALKERVRLQKEASDELHNDLKGAFSAALRDTGGDPLQAFGDALANLVYSRTATALAEAATESLMSSSLGSLFGGTSAASPEASPSTASSLMSLASLLLPSFDGGGHTGIGPRSGGLDGKGGFMALVHPNESVVDHTKGQSAPTVQPITVVQNFTVGDVASVGMVQKAVANSERRIAGAMGRSMQYGGALA